MMPKRSEAGPRCSGLSGEADFRSNIRNLDPTSRSSRPAYLSLCPPGTCEPLLLQTSSLLQVFCAVVSSFELLPQIKQEQQQLRQFLGLWPMAADKNLLTTNHLDTPQGLLIIMRVLSHCATASDILNGLKAQLL